MRIAIVGKGGSGKSSISWLITKFLAHKNNQVLAIDADYNMDLAHNLGVDPEDMMLLKHAEKDLYEHFNLDLKANAFDIVKNHTQESFTVQDSFTKKYARDIEKNIRLMVLGDHDEETMYSGRCSHAYAKAIKFYLPYLKLEPHHVVIIDSVAGTDMLNYGLYLGVDVIVCVVEDTPNSVTVMQSTQRIASMLSIPFVCVANKIQHHNLNHIPHTTITHFKFDPALASYTYDNVLKENIDACAQCIDYIQNTVQQKSTIYRLTEWKKRHEQHT